MSKNSLVSVVIPCFNRQEYIEQAINSALSQTYADIEIIVVDDGSTDSSIKVIERYGERVKLITQSNKGVSAARNTGFSSARGEFIIFLDSDDWLSEDIVEKHILTAHKYPEADIYCTDSTTVNSKGELNPINKSNWPESPDTPLELFLLTPPSISCL
ncbi:MULTISPECIES: glycosyltransferase family 2 protein [unclassified Methylophaga]|jgi:glycosyltransferase involved in cell wall biosynthesis|uniref:glycosyltransferase family 2 protein n=1 Tax=unclassified Methylophaga TaxID=2629249 RepID=UPI0025FF5CA4|nr:MULTISPECIES: glycosyltransferase family A protein [unclassified Methylophaga]|tara:strand:- start:6129 stop:6602 length:474 start_codon:yes stop_codon:yes gene_type:complete